MLLNLPTSLQNSVTHVDLVKFGLDMTQKATQATASKISSSNIQSLTALFYLPQVIYVGVSNGVIQIKRIKKFKKKKKEFQINVDRETGYVIESKEGFSDILKFDHTTLPEKDDETICKVGYWNTFNQYVDPTVS